MAFLFDYDFDPPRGLAFPAWVPGNPWFRLLYPPGRLAPLPDLAQ